MIHLLAQFGCESFDVDALKKFFDGFRAHHCFEAGGRNCWSSSRYLVSSFDNFVIFDRSFAGFDHE